MSRVPFMIVISLACVLASQLNVGTPTAAADDATGEAVRGPRTPPPTPGASRGGTNGARGRIVRYDLRTGEKTVVATLTPDQVPGHDVMPGSPEESAGRMDPQNFGPLQLIADPEIGDYPRHVRLSMWIGDTWGSADYMCSGTLIDPKHVLTAGHCVFRHFDPEFGVNWPQFADRIRVEPGYNLGVSDRFGKSEVVGILVWEGWLEDRDYDHDLAVLELGRPVGAIAGWRGYGYNSDCSFFESPLWWHYVYPAEGTDPWGDDYEGDQMYARNGDYDGCNSTDAWFDSNGLGGTSGGGAYNAGAVYGVRSHSLHEAQGHDTRLRSGNFGDIQGFIASHKPSGFDLVALDCQINENGEVVEAGSTLETFSFRIVNYSHQTFTGSIPWSVYMSTDPTITTGDTWLTGRQESNVTIPPNTVYVYGINNITIPANTPAGTKYIAAYIHRTDANEDNNSPQNVQDVAVIHVDCTPAGEVSLVSPYSGSACHSRFGVRLDWTDATNASTYKVAVGRACYSTGPIVIPIPHYTTTSSTYTVGDLDPNTRYYWRVKAISACGSTSDWTPCRTFITDGVPNPPTPASPDDGVTCESTGPTFEWRSVLNAEYYEVRVGTSWVCGFGEVRSTSVPSIEWDGLDPDTEYLWSVRATTWCGETGAYSDCRSFKTAPLSVPVPAAISPADGSDCGSPSPVVRWQGHPDAVSYDVQHMPDCSTPAMGTTNVTGTSFSIPVTLSRGEAYAWRVRTNHPCGMSSPWSPCYTFTVDDERPDDIFTLDASHAVGTWSKDPTIDVAWVTPADNCSVCGSSVVFDESPDTLPDEVVELTTVDQSHTSATLDDGVSHYVHERAVDCSGLGSAGAAHLGPFWIDATPPTAPTGTASDVPPDLPGNYESVTVTWWGETDNLSGVLGASLMLGEGVFIPNPDLTPEVVGGDSYTFQLDSPPPRASGGFGQHTYYVKLRIIDVAGNGGPTVTMGPYIVDPSAPRVEITAPAGGEHLYANDVFEITWQLEDPSNAVGGLLELRVDGQRGDEIASLSGPEVRSESYLWTVPGDVATERAAIGLRVAMGFFPTETIADISPLFEIGEVVAVEAAPEITAVALGAAVPNPFNPRTTISFELPQTGEVRLHIYDVGGRLVRTLVDGTRSGPARHHVPWDGTASDGRVVASGVYIYRLSAGAFTGSRRMVLLK